MVATLLRISLYLLALFGLLFIALVVGNAYAAEPFTLPPTAQLIVSSPLPCDGMIHFYDTDGDMSTAEYVIVQRTADPSPLLVIRYGDGADGKFEYGEAFPPLPSKRFVTTSELTSIYPTPCAAIQAAGPSTRI